MATVTIGDRYLVMCDAGNNNNKFYRMHPNSDGTTFTVEYGRVGAHGQSMTYPIAQFNKKYNEKVHKGYKDTTDMRKELVVAQTTSGIEDTITEFTDVTDAGVKEIIRELQMYALRTLKANYRVSSASVTQSMVDIVDENLHTLDGLLKQYVEMCKCGVMNTTIVQQFDMLLQQGVFTAIPRVMSQVSKYIVCGTVDLHDTNATARRMAQIIDSERALLNVMRTRVVQNQHITKNTSATTLKSLGLEITPCTDKDIAIIRRELGTSANRLCGAWCVKNLRTHDAFENFKREHKGNYQRFPCKLLWHGSRNQNWWSIINSGLKLSPQNAIITGKMFGRGIYFAPKAQKSIGYTSVPDSYWNKENESCGFLALYATAYGKPYNVNTNCGISTVFGWYDLQKRCPGTHCVHAHAGTALRNDEIIFYNEAQCTIKYIVKIK